jgi:membrane protein implicated in regulation of membrane protease activity
MFELPPNKSPDLTLFPLLWLAICFIAGIAAARFLIFDWKISFGLCAAFAFLTIFFLKRKFCSVESFKGFIRRKPNRFGRSGGNRRRFARQAGTGGKRVFSRIKSAKNNI